MLSHCLPDRTKKLVTLASCSLGHTERKYSQLDKEGMAIIFDVRRFHQYLDGRHFTILSYHKPLQHLIKESSGVPTLASAQLQ